jgi:hypothetical protein
MFVKFRVNTPKGEKVVYKNFPTLRDAIAMKSKLMAIYGKENVKQTVINKY